MTSVRRHMNKAEKKYTRKTRSEFTRNYVKAKRILVFILNQFNLYLSQAPLHEFAQTYISMDGKYVVKKGKRISESYKEAYKYQRYIFQKGVHAYAMDMKSDFV